MKLYWRVKIGNKWTYKAAETYRLGEKNTLCVKELKE